MNFCPNCGAALQPDERFCSACGTPVAQQAPANQYAQPANDPFAQNQVPYNPPVNIVQPEGQKKNNTPIILGAIAIVFSWIFALVGHILAIVGLVQGVKEYKTNKNVAALVLPIIGEVCAVISSVIGVISIWKSMGIL